MAAHVDEALAALDDFVESRLTDFGHYEDAMMLGDDTMAHARLSVPLNIGLMLNVQQRVGSGAAPGATNR